MMPRLAALATLVILAGCTSTSTCDMPIEQGAVTDERELESRTNVALRLHGHVLDGDRVEVSVERVSRPVRRVERTVHNVRVLKRAEARWSPAVHIPVWLLGLPVLAPAWVYPAFYGDLERASEWGLDLEPGHHEPTDSVFGPLVEVEVVKTPLAGRTEIVEIPGDETTAPAAGAHVEAAWAGPGIQPVSGTTDASGRAILSLGPLPSYVMADTPILLSANVDGRWERVQVNAQVVQDQGGAEPPRPVVEEPWPHQETPRYEAQPRYVEEPWPHQVIEETARREEPPPVARPIEPARPPMPAAVELPVQLPGTFQAWVADGKERFARETESLAEHLLAGNPHFDTARKILNGWQQWGRRTSLEIGYLPHPDREDWTDRLRRFRRGLDQAQAALDEKDAPIAIVAARQALTVLEE